MVEFPNGWCWPNVWSIRHFLKFVGDNCDHPYPLKRYQDETQRLLDVIEANLEDNEYMAGDEYSIADIALWPWVSVLSGFYDASQLLELDDYEAVNNWHKQCLARPASKLAPNIPSSQ